MSGNRAKRGRVTNLPEQQKVPDITQTEPPYRLGVAGLHGLSVNETEITFDGIEDLIAHVRNQPVPEDKWYRFVGLDLTWRNFSGMDLEHCIFEDCDFSGADLSDAILQGARIENCNFKDADLSHARLYNSVLENNDLSGAVLRKAEIKGVHDKNSNFSRAVFDGAEMTMCEFTGTDISECAFDGVEMRDIRFKAVRARDADLSNLESVANISLEDTNFVGANLSARFRKAAKGGATFDPRVSARQMEALKRIRKIRKPGGP